MEPLKLVALDQADLEIVSAHAQDAVCKVSDLDYWPGEKRFLVTVNRFVWEGKASFFRRRWERRLSVLQFDRVLAVRTNGIDRSRPGEVLSLLAIRFEDGEAPAGTIELVFAGGAAAQLDVECIEARLADVGGAWETRSRPRHGR
jgi:hypothetical protein